MMVVKDSKAAYLYFIFILQIVGMATQNCPSPCYCNEYFEVFCNNTGISEIPRGIPKEAILLDLGGNKIKKIPYGTLNGLVNLIGIGLGNLGFSGHEIEAGALNLPNLTEVDLSFNKYKMVPPNLPKSMSTMYFSNNPIEVLDARSFDDYSSLEYIDMSNCNVTHIKPNTFDALVNVDIMHFAFTKLTNAGIPDAAFAKNKKLNYLNLRFNKLTRLLKGLPSSLESIEYIGNPIKEIPSNAFLDVPNLKTLGFMNSSLTKMNDNAFAGLEKLELLDFMSAAIISPITNNTFKGLTSLETITLDDNHIPSIDIGAFRDFKILTSLRLSGNNLTTLNKGVLDSKFIPNLNTLFIDFNPWHCDCHLRWLREKVGNASYVIEDPNLIVCHGPEKVAGKSWNELKPEDFVCN
ncbi:hypothetical protein FSP39_006566 [Pinctada imbricata]|uniref:LRRCT domain-containing protein n=1 Tax=Pinctada imbricata TaxID=66713 RepID=A0AA89BV24_PINIB|nr:hypothetical protein FSP39_006566 [Pinctada imbricata]